MGRRRNRFRADASGFTLLEILVALAIIGGAMFVLLDAQWGAMQLHHEATKQVLLRSLMSRALGQAQVEIAAGTLDGGGDFGNRYPDYSYTFTAAPVTEEAPTYVELVVTIESPDDEPLELHMFVYVPEQQTQ